MNVISYEILKFSRKWVDIVELFVVPGGIPRATQVLSPLVGQ